MKHYSKCVHTFSSLQRISVIMQDGSAANQSVCLQERSLPSEEQWTVLHSIKPPCDVECKVGRRGGLRHPLSVFIRLRGAQLSPNERIFTVEQNIHRQGAQSSEEALHPSRTVFVCVQCEASVSSGLCCDLSVPVSGTVVVFEQVWDLRS